MALTDSLLENVNKTCPRLRGPPCSYFSTPRTATIQTVTRHNDWANVNIMKTENAPSLFIQIWSIRIRPRTTFALGREGPFKGHSSYWRAFNTFRLLRCRTKREGSTRVRRCLVLPFIWIAKHNGAEGFILPGSIERNAINHTCIKIALHTVFQCIEANFERAILGREVHFRGS